MKKILQNALKFLLFFGVGATILYLVFKDQSAKYMVKCIADGNAPEDCNLLDKIISDFASANYFWLFMVLLVYTLSNVSRTIRWNMLIHPLGYKPSFWNSFCAIMLGYFANLGLPRAGEILRPATLARYENIPIEKLMGTVVTDRIIDMLSFAFVIAFAFLLEFDTLYNFIVEQRAASVEEAGSSQGLPWLLILGGIMVVGLILVVVFFNKLKTTNLYKKVHQLFIGFWEGIQTVRKLDKPGWFIFHSINIWFMYFLMTYVGTFSYEPVADLGAQGSFVVFVTGALGIVIPSPGGMGSYQYLVTTVLENVYNIAGNEAFSFSIILFFAVQLGSNVLLGFLSLIALPLINRKG